MHTTEGLVPEVYVQPGESCVVTEPSILRTVLGSCVGIAFSVPRLGVAALCHPMLPRCPATLHHRPEGTRYVDFVIRDMARHLDSLGAEQAETQVKVFGGADVLNGIGGHSRPTVGRLNSDMALRILEEEGFNIVACSLGGKSGVQIQFHTGTGEIFLRRLDACDTRRRQKFPEHSARRK